MKNHSLSIIYTVISYLALFHLTGTLYMLRYWSAVYSKLNCISCCNHIFWTGRRCMED